MRRVTVEVTAVLGLGLTLSVLPAAADSVSVGINIGLPAPPPVVIAAPPQLAIVPGTAVLYAPYVGVPLFSYGGWHYTHHNGAWFVARTYRGPWSFVAVERVPRPVLAVPVAYYKAPPGHVKHAPPGHSKQPGGPPAGKGGHGHKGKD